MPAFLGSFTTDWERTGRTRHVPRTVRVSTFRSADVLVLQFEERALRYQARCPDSGNPPSNARHVVRWVDATIDDVLPGMGSSAAGAGHPEPTADWSARKSA